MIDSDTLWFVGGVMLTAAAGGLGVMLGRQSPVRARVAMGLGMVWMVGWGWLVHHPAVALEAIPAAVLSRIEGFGGVPAFMLILGAAWSRSGLPRQRVAVLWAAAFGGVYFFNGGFWLLQDTPSEVMGHGSPSKLVIQSQDYSCVPAACATALNLLEVPSTEAQMAEYTDVRPGTGATVVRALAGLERRLAGSPLRPRLVEVEASRVQGLLMPALTPFQYVPGARHMVVLLQASPRGVLVMDPQNGLTPLDWEGFRGLYRGQVIVFEGPRAAVSR